MDAENQTHFCVRPFVFDQLEILLWYRIATPNLDRVRRPSSWHSLVGHRRMIVRGIDQFQEADVILHYRPNQDLGWMARSSRTFSVMNKEPADSLI